MRKALRHLSTFETVRFLWVGSLCTVVNYGLFLLLFSWWGNARFMEATAASFVPAFILGFMLQKFWTFRSIREGAIYREFVLYCAKQAIFFTANLMGMEILVGFMGYEARLIQFVLLALSAPLSYLAQRWIFAH